MEQLEHILERFKEELKEVVSKASTNESTVETMYAVQQILICAEKTLTECARATTELKHQISKELVRKKSVWGGP